MRSPWAIYKGDNLTSDQIDHLISLGALNRDEVIIAKVNQPDNFRLFPKAVVAMLVLASFFPSCFKTIFRAFPWENSVCV